MTIRRSVFYNTILQVSQILFPIMTFPYISRVLGPEGFGVANFTTNLSGLFISLVSLGVPLYGMREIAKLKGRPDEIRKTTSELFILHLLYSLLGLLIYSIVVFNYFISYFIFDKINFGFMSTLNIKLMSKSYNYY